MLFPSALAALLFPAVLLVSLTGSVGARRRRTFVECSERAVEEAEDRADTVVSGTVERVLQSGAQASTRVVRVLKGPPELNGSVVLVTGLDRPDLCDAKLREGDSRLFVLRSSGASGAKTDALASPLRLTLSNLDRLQAAVDDEPHRRRPQVVDLPCEAKYCAWSGDCSPDGGARCSCPDGCGYDPVAVCGRDGRTYSSRCRLRVDACRKRERVWVRHRGPCHGTPAGGSRF